MYPNLVETSEETYSYPEFQPSQSVVEFLPTRTTARESELSRRRVLLHVALFVATFATATFTGANFLLFGQDKSTSYLGFALSIVTALPKSVAAGNFGPLIQGLIFAGTLLLILSAHEFGHYFACRHYKIRATLPFYVPGPPFPITPFGTFGAVIKIKEPFQSKRALFDVGIAGPLAGFAFAVPASIIGLAIAKAVPVEVVAKSGGPLFWDPPLFKIIMKLLGTPQWMEWNPVYWAAWAALLVTALNLFPVGQLDGGHVLYAALGPRLHKLVSRIVCAAVAILAVVAFVLYRSPIWFLWTAVLIFLLRVGHPPTATEEPLGKARIALAIFSILVFALCFMPFPMTLS
jgi:membrane-associated protease RseP (regulator of RpoE activity)